MLDSGADVAMCFDADMRIVDRNAARMLPRMASRFGICLPINPRYLVKVDGTIGADSDWNKCLEETIGELVSLNCSPIAINLEDSPGTELAEVYCEEMLDYPVRGPIAWARAMWETGIVPLILAPQFCVCEKHIGCGNEIILHEGHDAVKRHYAAHRTS